MNCDWPGFASELLLQVAESLLHSLAQKPTFNITSKITVVAMLSPNTRAQKSHSEKREEAWDRMIVGVKPLYFR